MAKDKKNETPEVEAEVATTETDETVEAPIDLTAFNSAVSEAVEAADEATGVVPEAHVSAVREAYQALDGIKPKNAAKAELQELMKGYLTSLDVAKAKAVMTLTENAAVAGSSKSSAPKREVNPAEVFQTNVAQLTLALYLAQRQVPEGVDGEAAVAAATEQANELFPTAVEVLDSEDQETDNAVIRSAIRLSTTKVRKARGGGSGVRRDLGAHIEEAFGSVDSGTFLTVAQIRKFESSVYGTDHPSAGAITNRLQPKSGNSTTIEGITVETRDGKLGAVKN